MKGDKLDGVCKTHHDSLTRSGSSEDKAAMQLML